MIDPNIYDWGGKRPKNNGNDWIIYLVVVVVLLLICAELFARELANV